MLDGWKRAFTVEVRIGLPSFDMSDCFTRAFPWATLIGSSPRAVLGRLSGSQLVTRVGFGSTQDIILLLPMLPFITLLPLLLPSVLLRWLLLFLAASRPVSTVTLLRASRRRGLLRRLALFTHSKYNVTTSLSTGQPYVELDLIRTAIVPVSEKRGPVVSVLRVRAKRPEPAGV